MTTVIVSDIERLVSKTPKRREYVRAFGYLVNDKEKKFPVEVPLSLNVAADLIKQIYEDPAVAIEIEVPKWGWAYCLNAGLVETVRVEGAQ